jgi:hypothetical protein
MWRRCVGPVRLRGSNPTNFNQIIAKHHKTKAFAAVLTFYRNFRFRQNPAPLIVNIRGRTMIRPRNGKGTEMQNKRWMKSVLAEAKKCDHVLPGSRKTRAAKLRSVTRRLSA